MSHFLLFFAMESNPSLFSNVVPVRPAFQISRVHGHWVNATWEEPKNLAAKVPKASTIKVTPMNGALHFQNAPVTNTNVGLTHCPDHLSHSVFIEQIKEWLLPAKDNKLWLYWLDSMPNTCESLKHINSFAPTPLASPLPQGIHPQEPQWMHKAMDGTQSSLYYVLCFFLYIHTHNKA